MHMLRAFNTAIYNAQPALPANQPCKLIAALQAALSLNVLQSLRGRISHWHARTGLGTELPGLTSSDRHSQYTVMSISLHKMVLAATICPNRTVAAMAKIWDEMMHIKQQAARVSFNSNSPSIKLGDPKALQVQNRMRNGPLAQPGKDGNSSQMGCHWRGQFILHESNVERCMP